MGGQISSIYYDCSHIFWVHFFEISSCEIKMIKLQFEQNFQLNPHKPFVSGTARITKQSPIQT